MQESNRTLVPLLVVEDAIRAIDFYQRVFGARELVRYMNRALGTVSHADLAIDGAWISITEAVPGWNSDAPKTLGGSPVVLQLQVEDVDAQVEEACAAGAEVVFPAGDFCGERMARIRDPFGHLWILRRPFEDLSIEEQQRRRDEFFAEVLAHQERSRKSP